MKPIQLVIAMVLETVVTPGNVHDSVAFDEVYEKVVERFPETETVVSDSAYKTPHICKKELYRQRKETIERVFADAKEKHVMRYTPYRGLAQTANWGKLKFSAMNLKKLAKWKWRARNHGLLSYFYCFIYERNLACA